MLIRISRRSFRAYSYTKVLVGTTQIHYTKVPVCIIGLILITDLCSFGTPVGVTELSTDLCSFGTPVGVTELSTDLCSFRTPEGVTIIILILPIREYL